MKNIKSKLITSIAVLVGCVTLLVGTSFAWFTDSITNSNNKIQAGELKISATAYDLGTGGKSYTVSGINGGKAFTFEADGQDLATVNTPIISETDWEPGKTSAKLLTVSNEDQLSAKIKLSFTTAGELTDALWYDFIQVTDSGVTGAFTQRDMSTLSALASAMEFTLETNETLSFIFVYGMKTSAGNEYQGKEFTADVTILATQAAVEEDGFGNSDYDSGAEYPVTDNEGLTSALNSADAGDKITLSSGNFTLANGVEIPEGVTISGNGAKNTTLTVPSTSSGTYTMGLIIDKPEVTISNITIAPNSNISNENYAGVIVVKEGGAVIDNVKITSNNSASPILVTGSTFGEGDSLTISNSTITSESRSIYIVDGTNGKVIIDNCDITGTYTFNVNSGNSQNLELEIKDSALHGWTSYGYIKSASFTNTSFSQGSSDYNFMRPYTNTTFSGCTFGDGFLIGAGATGLKYEFTDCEYADGTAVTAYNIKDKLLDPTGDDIKVLDCTIIVDGISAELQ